MDTRPEIKGITVAETTEDIARLETEEYALEFSRIAEMAKYPPFSLPQNLRESEFLVNLSKEYDLFVNGEKPYNSFDDVLVDYAEEVNLAMSWMALGYSPVEAAFEHAKRGMSFSSGSRPEDIDRAAKTMVQMSITTLALSEDPIYPWEFM